MKNKGFTLVELLAVISIIGVVIILLVPTLMQTFTNSKNLLNEYSLEGVEDAGKMYITDLDNGILKYEYQGSTPVEVNGHTYSRGQTMSSYDFKVYVIDNGGILVNMETLVNGGYYDKNCKYAGTKITYTENGVEKTKVVEKDQDCNMPKECTLRVGIDGKLVENDTYYVTNGYTAEIISGCE